MELLKTYQPRHKRKHVYDTTKTTLFGRYFWRLQIFFFESDKPQFLSLIENHIDLDEIIPVSFYNHYYAATGRNRKYPLTAMLWTLIIQRLFSIPTDSLLLVFLHYSRHLREFCGFSKVPDASKITRFQNECFAITYILYIRHLQNATSHINTAFFCY